jgi:hypothetical protein
MSFTLTTLRTSLKEYTENTETSFVNNLDLFIRLAEERILKSVQVPDQRKNVQGNVTSSNRFLATPSDFLAPFSLAVISSNNYDYLDLNNQPCVESVNTSVLAALSTATVKSASAPRILLEFLPIVKLLVSKVPA